MSCLPQLFLPSKSQNINPTKIGGHFSLHLKSALFNGRKEEPNTVRKSFLSSDNKRYRSWMDTERSFQTTKRSSRSFFHKQRVNKDHSIEQNIPVHQNTNTRGTQQSQMQAISNFKIIRKTALQHLQLAKKIIEVSSSEEQKINEELKNLKQKLNKEIEEFDESFREQLVAVLRIFKEERRGTIKDNKTVGQQIDYLSEEMKTIRETTEQQQNIFSGLTSQFF